ncbi:MAG: YebC/PmpR family DNA-binding transcriptional regulator, partial [Bacteroidales bacterium]|nr:YebC/PmpR family DNA-binding transcriptional regulator [Bacteroidales bacterium]
VRAAFNKFNGTLGTNGSLSFLFDRKGVFDFAKPEDRDFDEIQMELIDAGAEEIEVEDGNVNVVCSIEDFGNMSKKLEELNIEVESAELQRIPNDTKTLSVEEAKSVLKLIDALEDDDDVQNVFHNMEMTDEIIEAME